MSSPQVTILVPNYKTPEITKICLRLLRKNTDFDLARVVVIDNHSQDASLEYLRTLKWITLIERAPEPDDSPALSHARALDLALGQVTTPFVLSIHTDTFIKRPDWLEYLLEEFRNDPQIAGVGSWKLEAKAWHRRLGRKIEEFWKKALFRLTGKKGYQDIRFDDSLHYLRSHCAMYRTEVICSLGTGFSDERGVAGQTMHRKMTEAGYRMVFLRSEILGQYIDHLNHATTVLNPDLGTGAKSLRQGQKRIREKLRGIDGVGILNEPGLDE